MKSPKSEERADDRAEGRLGLGYSGWVIRWDPLPVAQAANTERFLWHRVDLLEFPGSVSMCTQGTTDFSRAAQVLPALPHVQVAAEIPLRQLRRRLQQQPRGEAA